MSVHYLRVLIVEALEERVQQLVRVVDTFSVLAHYPYLELRKWC